MKNAWRSPGAGAALIILLTVVAYLPALHGGFVWDDDTYVTNNQTLRSAEGLRQIWLNPSATVQYYPLTFTVFWAEYHLWGLHPFGFHLVNVLLQAANAVLFWRLLSRLGVPGGWWAAAVFALHPVHVMSVAWVTELKNVMSGFFYLAALLSYLRFCGLDGDGTIDQARRRWAYGLALGLNLCALLSKTATSILPVTILMILWWKQGRIGRKELAPTLPFVAMSVLFGAFTLWLEKFEKGASGREFTLTFLERFLVAGRSFWFCLGKLVWPARLTFFYPRWQIDTADAGSYLFPLGAIVLLIALCRARQRVGRAPLAALVYFSLAFPALVMVQVLYMMRFSFVADHWQYLGSMSIIPLATTCVVLAFRRWYSHLLGFGLAAGTAVLCRLGMLTWQQGQIYHDLDTFYRDTLTKNPTAWVAHSNLGVVLREKGNIEEAIRQYEQALQIKPDYAEAHCNLGNAFSQTGKIQLAIAHYEQALQVRPDYLEAHNGLAFALLQAGKVNDAIAHLEQAVQVGPNSVEAQYNLGLALVLAGRSQDAIKHLERAVQLKPEYAEAHYILGNALLEVGKKGEAITHYEQAVQLKPDFSDARNALAFARAAH